MEKGVNSQRLEAAFSEYSYIIENKTFKFLMIECRGLMYATLWENAPGNRTHEIHNRRYLKSIVDNLMISHK